MMMPLSLTWLSDSIPAVLKTKGAALLAVAALQIGSLGVMLGERLSLLKSGREIVLKTAPVDPRDFFKGDFARLGYDISTIPKPLALDPAVPHGAAFYVTLVQGDDGTWRVAKTAARYPAAVAANEIVLRARDDTSTWWATSGRVRYGIERYYVPEGTGTDIEKLARDHRLEVIVSVGASGDAAIKGLAVDGKRVYDEPLL